MRMFTFKTMRLIFSRILWRETCVHSSPQRNISEGFAHAPLIAFYRHIKGHYTPSLPSPHLITPHIALRRPSIIITKPSSNKVTALKEKSSQKLRMQRSPYCAPSGSIFMNESGSLLVAVEVGRLILRIQRIKALRTMRINKKGPT